MRPGHPLPALWALCLMGCIALLPSLRAEELSPDRLFARGVYAEVFRGDLSEARGEYEKILAADCDADFKARARLRMGLCFAQEGKREQARFWASEVLTDPTASAALKARARLLTERLDAPERLKMIQGKITTLTKDNERLRKTLEDVQRTLQESKAREDEKSRQVRKELSEKIEALQRQISARERERDDLRSEVRRLQRKGTGNGDPEGAKRAAHEILRKLENEREILQEEREYLADNYFQNGNRFLHRGEYDKAVENYRSCLSVWPHHPKARRQLLVVKALLGDREGTDQEPPPVIREIEREVWRTQRRIEVTKTFREGVDFYRIRLFKEAGEKFQKVVELITATFPGEEEFEGDLRMARRYLGLAQREVERPRTAAERQKAPLVTRIHLFALTPDGLGDVLRPLDTDFRAAQSTLETRSFVVWTDLDPVQRDVLLKAARRSGQVLSFRPASLILENGVREAFERFTRIPYRGSQEGRPTDSPKLKDILAGLRVSLHARFEDKGAVVLEAEGRTTLHAPVPLLIPHKGGTLQIPLVTHQTFRTKTRLFRGATLVFLGLSNPFESPGAAVDTDGSQRTTLLVILRLEES